MDRVRERKGVRRRKGWMDRVREEGGEREEGREGVKKEVSKEGRGGRMGVERDE